MSAPSIDARVLEALQQASSLELFQLSTVIERLLADLPPQQLRATTYFASAIGGASEMTLLTERLSFSWRAMIRCSLPLILAYRPKPSLLRFARRCEFISKRLNGSAAKAGPDDAPSASAP